MSKCIDDDTLNKMIANYLKRRNYGTPNQSLNGDNKFTLRELIASEFVTTAGSYDHQIGFATNHSDKTNYFSDCNRCLEEFFNYLDNLSLDNETRLSLSFSIFIHLFIDLFLNDFKEDAKLFFNNHQHKFNCFNQLKRTIDMIHNSIKTQQLDKRLIKIRSYKISIQITENDHRLLLNYLENESLSKNLHQVINQNFSFSILSDKSAESKIKKLLTMDNNSHLDTSMTEDNEVKFKEFKNLFNGKSKEEEVNDREKKIRNEFENKMRDKILIENNLKNEESSSKETDLITEFDSLVNNLKTLAPQLPEVLTYKLSSNDCHICCADLRDDLRYCCSGTENSEVLVHLTDLKPNFDLKSNWLSSDQEPSLIEEKQDKNQNKFYSFYGHHDSVVDMKFVPNSNYLLTCSIDTNSILWDLDERETKNYLKKKYYGHTQPIYSLDINCLGTHFATASRDYTSRLFSLDKSHLLRSFVGHQNSVNCVQFHQNSKYLATGSSDYSIRIWDISTSNMVRVFNCQTEIYSLCYSTDGQYLASAGTDNKIKIWDLTNGKLLNEFNSMHTRPANSLSFNLTNTILISSSIDQQINFWNFKTISKHQSSETRPMSSNSLILNKNLLIKVRRAKFTHSDLLVAVGT